MSKAKRFPASVPREMFWSTDVGGTSTCPQCRSRLKSERHTYVMVIRESGDVHSFIVGNDGGHFCPGCATVVLDREAFTGLVSLTPAAGRAEFAVLGLVDLDAVPKEKSEIPLGDDDNPIPLVKFTNLHRPKPEAPGSRNRLPRWRPKRSRK